MSSRAVLFFVFVPWLAARPVEAGVVAKILNVEGEVQILNEQEQSRRAEQFGSLRDDELVILPEAGSISIGVVATRSIEKLSGPSKSEVNENGFVQRENVDVVRGAQEVRKSVQIAMNGLPKITKSGAGLARSPEFQEPTILPMADSTVLPADFTCEWPAVAGADKYVVDLNLGADFIWRGRTTAENRLVHRGGTPLKSGRSYAWKVYALMSDGSRRPAGGGEFRVLDDEDLELATSLDALAATEQSELIALAAVTYEDLELLSQALKAYEKLAQLSPNSAPVHAALAELYARAGRRSDAEKSRDQALELGYQFRKNP